MVTQWQIDPLHSSASFSIRHMMFAKVNGSFTRLSGALRMDRDNPANSSVEAVIETASIDTREAKRDEYLRSPEFLDVRKYPHIIFKSTKVRPAGSHYEVVGDLTIRGVTRAVTLEVKGMDSEIKDSRGNTRVGGSATARIRRKDFGLSWNAAIEAGGVLVGDDVNVTLDVQFVRPLQ